MPPAVITAEPLQGEVIEPGTEIVAAVTQNPGIVLLDSEKFDAFYERLKAETDKLVPDTTTAKGRDEIRSLAARVRSSKAAIDKARLQLTKEWRDNVARANEAGKIIETRLEGLAVEVRKPLTEWEDAEKARVDRAKELIAWLHGAAIVTLEDTAEIVRERGKQVWETTVGPELAEFEDEARQAKDATVAKLKADLARLTREEEERAELERLRAEAAERERLAAEKAAQEEAERRRAEEERLAEERRIAAEKAEAERIEQAKREAAEAERLRVEREHAEALAAERRRAEDAERAAAAERERAEAEEAARAAEAKRLADEQAKRDADQKHRTAVKSAAKMAIMSCGTDEETARKIVVAILANEIPNVTLRF